MLWKAQLAAAPGIVNMLQQSMEYNVSVCVCVCYTKDIYL